MRRAMQKMTTTTLQVATTTLAPLPTTTRSPVAVAVVSSPPFPRSSPSSSYRPAKFPPFTASRQPLGRMTPKRATLPSVACASASSSLSPSSRDAAAAPPPTAAPTTPRGGPPPPRPGALPFDTPLAIALAGAAFEAYNSPTGFDVDSKGNDFALVDADGARTHYLDPKVLAAASCGGVVATVRVSRAQGLPASDAWGTSDPYFLAELKGRASAHQSAVVSRTCSPVFDDEEFELLVGRPPPGGGSRQSGGGGGRHEEQEDPLDAVLRISFFDSDALTADDALGSAEISLRELSERTAAAGGEEVELELHAPRAAAADAAGAAAEGAEERGNSSAAGSVFLSGSVRTLSEPEIASRASGSIAPDGADEVARMSRAWRSLAKAAAAAGGVAGDDSSPADSIFEPAAFIENPASDTQLWMGVDRSSRSLMIAFRGTETTKILDVLTDLNAVKASLDARAAPGEPGALPLPPYARVSPKSAARGGPPLGPVDRDSVWCHQGFLAAYRSVRCSVLRVAGECLAAHSKDASSSSSSSSSATASAAEKLLPWRILFTGHSLGGALATLCSYEFAHLEFSDAEAAGGVERLIVYNFGSPRVGSGAFAAHFDSALPDCWRVVNAADLVPRVPRLLGYAHVGHAVPLKADGTFDDEAIAENYALGLYGDGDYAPVSSSPSSPASPAGKKASFASPAAAASEEIEPIFDEEGANVVTAATALAQAAASALFGGAKKKGGEGGEGEGKSGSEPGGGYLKEKQAAADAVSKLISSEIKTMNDFLSGDAVVHHTEAVYLEVLRKAVDAATDLARELEEEARGENVAGEVEAAAKKAAEAAKDLIEEAQR